MTDGHTRQFEVGDSVRYTGAFRDMGGMGWVGTVTSCDHSNVYVSWLHGPDLFAPKPGVYPDNLEPWGPWDMLLDFDARVEES